MHYNLIYSNKGTDDYFNTNLHARDMTETQKQFE